MIQARAWPVRAMYILIAAALAISLFITAAPAPKVSANPADDVVSKWTRVSTPTTEDWVLAPESTIIDYALGDGGDVAYAIVYGYDSKKDKYGYWLLKSENGAATWENIIDVLEKVRTTQNITLLVRVATDWVDGDFVAVALVETDGLLHVFVSKDGGTTFKDAGEVRDTRFFSNPNNVSDLAVSLEGADNTRDIAISGQDDQGNAALFRCTVIGDLAGAWHDATAYDGWDNVWLVGDNPTDNFNSTLVTDIIFSPSWETDRTILAVTVTGIGPYTVHLQSGTLGETSGAWNGRAGFVAAVPIKENVFLPMYLASLDARGIAGIALPSDYSGDSSLKRYAWVWVNYYNPAIPADPYVGEIFRVKNGLHTSVNQQIEGTPWLTNVSYWGTIAEGKAIAGALGNGAEDYAACCGGIQVYHKDGIKDMDICCPAWEEACKLPTGRAAMAVSYVSADKAYAVALQSYGPYDEGAWSVSVDGDGLIWNQLSLVDTYIDYLSDVAVSPDCNKIMLVTVNLNQRGCGCDSVWLKANDNLPEAEEYSGHWLRTWCGRLTGDNTADFWYHPERGLLRLAPEETTGDTVYLVDRMTSTIYYNDLETWNCWETRSSATEISYIVDLAVKDESTIYALSSNGDVAMSDDHGKAITWTDAVKSEVANGWAIAVRNSDVLVGGHNGDVSYSEDDGETFTELEETPTIGGLVSVAFDSYFDTNNIVYAATALAKGQDGIYRWSIGESDKWENMGAEDYDYTGIVLGRNPGNPKTSADTGGVLYASYLGEWCNDDDYYANLDPSEPSSMDCWNEQQKCWYTGVARSLNPAETIACLSCVEWDYLTVGLTQDEWFVMGPQALKICGCMEPTTNTKLFAIGNVPGGYDMADGEEGTVWTFEDCYAKKAPDVTDPIDGAVILADPCSCYNAPFSITWDRLCDACHYEIQFALDEGFDTAWGSILVPPKGSKSITSFLVPGGKDASLLSCETTYYLRVRAYQAGTCQVIRSWWSDPLKITIAPSTGAAAIDLISPVPGAQGVAVKNVGFSWDLLATADAFDWKLSTNADLSSPVDSKNVTTTACTYTKAALAYGTTYYWQVIAYNEGVVVSTSAVGTFTTAPTGAFCCPQCGLCFDTQAALQAHIADAHPAQPATPFWVWVIIAIGAVLVIVVIVLIFRTRRV